MFNHTAAGWWYEIHAWWWMGQTREFRFIFLMQFVAFDSMEKRESTFLGSMVRHCVSNVRTILSRMSLLNMCGNFQRSVLVFAHASTVHLNHCKLQIHNCVCVWLPVFTNNHKSLWFNICHVKSDFCSPFLSLISVFVHSLWFCDMTNLRRSFICIRIW